MVCLGGIVSELTVVHITILGLVDVALWLVVMWLLDE